jgi:uncharacterized protein with NRDE domain
MCLILFQLNKHPKYKLVLAANRDEAYNRPTAQAQFWDDKPNILAGRDLLQMGTWLGMTKSGRFAALTNYRDPAHMKPSKHSRGHIVADYLESSKVASSFLDQLSKRKTDYVGFNVLVGDVNQLLYFNNIEDKITTIPPGTHGLSNHFFNTPWPKVVKGKERLRDYLKHTESVDKEELFQILANTDEAQEESLPDTGIGLQLEKKLSSMFIKLPEYGTRCSTVLTVDYDNQVSFTERTFEAGEFVDEVKYEFSIK